MSWDLELIKELVEVSGMCEETIKEDIILICNEVIMRK